MGIGILVIGEGKAICDSDKFAADKVAKKLVAIGYFVKSTIFVSETKLIKSSFQLLKDNSDAVLVVGNCTAFFDEFSSQYEFNRKANVIELDGTAVAITNEFNDKFLQDVFIPMLNGKVKTYYASAIFKVFGKTSAQLKLLLKDYIKNRNKIAFKFFDGVYECEVQLRYSNKTDKTVVDEMIGKVTLLLAEDTYALTDISLAKQVADLLKLRSKTLAVAESFTGGQIASSLVAFDGISACLKEGIVCYSNASKIKRLNVESEIIEHYGAVSIETVYEMAANLIVDGNYDLVAATSGNAGPSSEKPNEAGVCFIAAGDKNGIHIYKYHFEGDRNTVIECGVKAALFQLYKLLKQNEFEIMLAAQEQEKII